MEYRNPTPTVDIIIEIGDGVVVIERANPPHGLALPGGFVDEGESMEHAAVREAREETGLEVELDELLYVYSDPARDPRQHTVSTVYIAKATGEPRGLDDAKRAFIAPRDSLPENFAFDHARILQDYLHFRKTGERPRPSEGR